MPSEIVQRLLGTTEGTPTSRVSRRGQPVIVKIADPIEEVQYIEAVRAGLDGIEDHKPGRGWLSRRRNRTGSTGVRPSGVVVVDGRACCAERLGRLDRRLHMLRLPYSLTCECGAKYRVEMRMTTDA